MIAVPAEMVIEEYRRLLAEAEYNLAIARAQIAAMSAPGEPAGLEAKSAPSPPPPVTER